MAENTRRGLFTLSGITGMLIATALLLAILAFLTMQAIAVQKANANNPYDPSPIINSIVGVKDVKDLKLKKISTENAKFDVSKL
jgi:hypothetical protein